VPSPILQGWSTYDDSWTNTPGESMCFGLFIIT
jgi:hypothetical protein